MYINSFKIQTQIILFVKDFVDPETEDIIDSFTEASRHNIEHDLLSQRIAFVVYKLGTEEALEKSFQFLEPGQIFLTSVQDGAFLRFKYDRKEEESITKENIIEFIKDFRDGKLEQFYVSQDPDTTEKFIPRTGVLNVVGSEYNERIIRDSQSYVVLFCTYRTEECLVALNTLKILDGKNENESVLKFAFIDVENNEVSNINIHRTPTIMLYMKGQKGTPKMYELDFTVGMFVSWLNV